MRPNFKILDDDLYLGHNVWLRWTEDGNGNRSGGLVIHRLEAGRYCWGSILLKSDPDAGTRPTWEFDGDYDFPTLSPSVLCQCKKLHGFIKEGRWEPC